MLSAAAMAEAVHRTEARAVWRLLAEAPDVVNVEFDCSAPADINTPVDYRELTK